MANLVLAFLSSAVAFSYGISNMVFYFLLSVKTGVFFEKPPKQFHSELAIGALFSTELGSCIGWP